MSWEACGAISDALYCAGGESSSGGATRHTYVYDPHADSWSPAADMPIDLWGSGYTTAEGRLLVSGGVTEHNSVVTNQGFGLDPASDTWTPISNSNNTLYRSGSACGFYKIGGNTGGEDAQNLGSSEVLPGRVDCGETNHVSWLAVNPTTLTLAPGASTTVTVTVDANVPDITQPGTYTAAVVIGTDTPYTTPTVPVSMTVNPPKTWGKITGTVTGPSGALPGATVQINTSLGHYTLRTDASGHYQLWLDVRNNPVAGDLRDRRLSATDDGCKDQKGRGDDAGLRIAEGLVPADREGPGGVTARALSRAAHRGPPFRPVSTGRQGNGAWPDERMPQEFLMNRLDCRGNGCRQQPSQPAPPKLGHLLSAEPRLPSPDPTLSGQSPAAPLGGRDDAAARSRTQRSRPGRVNAWRLTTV
ncbi:carboxypeptidase-like regulatory domain-containing protein [Micromonospora inositola]|uniref:Kelch motif-containing protein n=1 Tax=Micromonospora inositola TaxID=47865 RepID=A0A1C5J6R9_9ACTN|nr:carboxypeptidase-like regulatory domain-containing protein [Micromonospora inositola]SCG66203.1 Kelch motif-containing protein [Micromonospora inositola]